MQASTDPVNILLVQIASLSRTDRLRLVREMHARGIHPQLAEYEAIIEGLLDIADSSVRGIRAYIDHTQRKRGPSPKTLALLEKILTLRPRLSWAQIDALLKLRPGKAREIVRDARRRLRN